MNAANSPNMAVAASNAALCRAVMPLERTAMTVTVGASTAAASSSETSSRGNGSGGDDGGILIPVYRDYHCAATGDGRIWILLRIRVIVAAAEGQAGLSRIRGLGVPFAVAFLSIVITLAVAAFLVARRKAEARKAVAWLRARYGRDLSLLAGCLLLDGRRRIPAVAAIDATRIVWRGVRFDAGTVGEIELASVSMVIWADAVRGAHPAIWRRLPGQVLSVIDLDGVERHFVFAEAQAVLWQKVLEIGLSDDDATSLKHVAEPEVVSIGGGV